MCSASACTRSKQTIGCLSCKSWHLFQFRFLFGTSDHMWRRPAAVILGTGWRAPKQIIFFTRPHICHEYFFSPAPYLPQMLFFTFFCIYHNYYFCQSFSHPPQLFYIFVFCFQQKSHLFFFRYPAKHCVLHFVYNKSLRHAIPCYDPLCPCQTGFVSGDNVPIIRYNNVQTAPNLSKIVPHFLGIYVSATFRQIVFIYNHS